MGLVMVLDGVLGGEIAKVHGMGSKPTLES